MKWLCGLLLTIPAFGTPILTGSVSLSCGPGTTVANQMASCSITNPAPWQASGASGLFTASGFNLEADANAWRPNGMTGNTSAFTSATLQSWVVITGGEGTGTLTSWWAGGGRGTEAWVTLNGVGGSAHGLFSITSQFEYGVPFLITEKVTAYADAIFQGDSYWIHSILQPIGSWATNLQQVEYSTTAVPEPQTSLIIGCVLLLLAKRSRYAR